MNWAVKNVMTTDVIWVERETPFAAIAAALRQYRVSAFPVLDEERHVIGVVSESDLLNKMALSGGEEHMPGMITGILRHKQLEKARGVKRLPVVDADGKLAGIVSRADVLTVYGRQDAEIGEDIRTSILSTEGAANPGAFDVAVTEGVVTLTGRPQTCEQGHDIVSRIRHVQGVVAVRDRLDYPAPGPDALDVLARFPAD